MLRPMRHSQRNSYQCNSYNQNNSYILCNLNSLCSRSRKNRNNPNKPHARRCDVGKIWTLDNLRFCGEAQFLARR